MMVARICRVEEEGDIGQILVQTYKKFIMLYCMLAKRLDLKHSCPKKR